MLTNSISRFRFLRRIPNAKHLSTIGKAKAAITVYGFPLSQPTRSVLLLCRAAGIPYKLEVVDALKGQNRNPAYLKIHPAGLVPAIVDENFVLGESAAILQYLAESRDLTSWYPKNAQSRAAVNFWLHWHHDNSRQATKGILVNQLFPQIPSAQEKLAAGVKKLTKSIAFMEKHLADHGYQYLASSGSPTIADLLVLTELDQLSESGFNLFDFKPYPLVGAWMDRLSKKLEHYEDIFRGVQEVALKYKK